MQYVGEIRRKNGPILLSETRDFLICLNYFLSFINGRKTSVSFLHGFHDGQITCKDYTEFEVDSYIFVDSWSAGKKIQFDAMWNRFFELWKNEENKSFLLTAVHWYLQANKKTALTEGSRIMAQTCLELIYNWLLIENEKIIAGKDAENIGAANKIRLLLSRVKISNEAPIGLDNLQDYIKQSMAQRKGSIAQGETIDTPEVVVQIRNAIVHSHINKRKTLSSIASEVRDEALTVCLWYIELSLLNILNYRGKYFNRCSREMQDVPWVDV